jgi:hypothetical protein
MKRDYSGKRLQLRFRRNLGGALKNFLNYIVDPGGYGDETKGDETKIRKLWRNASHISFVESNNFRNFPRSGMGNKTKIK